MNENNKCINYSIKNDIFFIMCLYVDESLIFDSNIHAANNMKKNV